jgi:hypothetical protein
MVKIDHPRATAFAASGPRPSNFPYTARFGNEVPFFGIARDEINERLALGVVPYILGLTTED